MRGDNGCEWCGVSYLVADWSHDPWCPNNPEMEVVASGTAQTRDEIPTDMSGGYWEYRSHDGIEWAVTRR